MKRRPHTVNFSLNLVGNPVVRLSLPRLWPEPGEKELITTGPFAMVRHPLYTGVAFLVLPWIGFLADTWLGLAVGLALYLGSRLYSPQEEETLCRACGAAWEEYYSRVKVPWL
jgi:protein-S-isoprenylcysteine O-methyltransferase Ste14